MGRSCDHQVTVTAAPHDHRTVGAAGEATIASVSGVVGRPLLKSRPASVEQR